MIETKQKVFGVVLSGGSGKRLWPKSREDRPKPFVKIFGDDTLIKRTYERVKRLGVGLLTVTNREYYFISRDEEKAANVAGKYILEPFARNTAPAIAIAAKFIEKNYGEDAMLLILPADHLIDDYEMFEESVRKAIDLAELGYLVTIGVKPNSYETGFGYIEKGVELEAGFEAIRFIEKPTIELAKKLVDSKKFLWNSGIYCFKVSIILEELGKFAPDVVGAIEESLGQVVDVINNEVIELPESTFKICPNVSIDYAVIEKSERVASVMGEFKWSDLGSWSSIMDFVNDGADGNKAVGETCFFDTVNTFVYSESRFVASLGVKDLIIIDSPDALLVANVNRAQDVSKLVSKLEMENNPTVKNQRTILRPWGAFTVLGEGSGFKIKRLEVKPGASISLQSHKYRSEHWVVVSGKARIFNGKSMVYVNQDESSYIPAGQCHRLENPTDQMCIIIEVQCGNYLGEDDIKRFDDIYGRA